MLGPILNGHLKKMILFFDEFNSSLHPALTEFMIDFFHNQQSYLKLDTENQFVINLHDTTLLNPSIFREDQIWFTEKDRYGSSVLYSLAEYKVRNDASYEKDYILGKYGAIPFLGDFQSLVD